MNKFSEIEKLLAETDNLPEIAAPPKRKKRVVHIDPPPGMNDQEAIAHAVVSTPLQAGMTIENYLGDNSFGTEARELTAEVDKQAVAVNAGDLRKVERLLVSQALSLDAIYNWYARQSAGNTRFDWKSLYLKMALHAQTNCVKTIEALAALKNPPKSAVFAEQANIAQNQQILNQSEVPTDG